LSSGPRSWWAATPRSARGAAIGGAVLVVALTITSAAVWASPGAGERPLTLEEQLAASEAEKAALQRQLDAAQAAAERTPTPATKPSSTPTPTPTPTQTPAPVPDEGSEPEGPDTVIVYRNQPSPVQPRPPAPAPAPAAPAPSPVTAPAKGELLQPAQRHFGMYTTQAPFNFATFDDAALKAGTRQSIVGYFGGWDQTYRGDAVTKAWERGLLPMLTWESRPIASQNDVVEEPDYSLPRILGDPDNGVPGAFDEYLRQYARDIVTTGLPLAIRLNHEMNGIWYPWAETTSSGGSLNGNRPGDYVAVWTHVHDIFEEEGANSLVIWTWAPNIINNLPSRNKSLEFLTALYPGDEYVDWIGISGYLRPPYAENQAFTFDYTFGSTLAQLRQVADKPIILAEIGGSENGGHKADWVTDVLDAFTRPENSDLIGLSWFNLAVTTISKGERVTNDWRIESRADSLEAFQTGIADPAANFFLKPY
jgi:mannan endo-1,4-beta-mannosidase